VLYGGEDGTPDQDLAARVSFPLRYAGARHQARALSAETSETVFD
jgi:hypothetical protein